MQNLATLGWAVLVVSACGGTELELDETEQFDAAQKTLASIETYDVEGAPHTVLVRSATHMGERYVYSLEMDGKNYELDLGARTDDLPARVGLLGNSKQDLLRIERDGSGQRAVAQNGNAAHIQFGGLLSEQLGGADPNALILLDRRVIEALPAPMPTPVSKSAQGVWVPTKPSLLTGSSRSVYPGVELRQSINALLTRSSSIAAAMANYITGAVVEEHITSIDHSDWESFIYDHRTYLEAMATGITDAGVSLPYGRLPYWNPSKSIPTNFQYVDEDAILEYIPTYPTDELPLEETNPSIAIESSFDADHICDYASLEDLYDTVSGWHGTVHVTVGGAMGTVSSASGAVIFWPWHTTVDMVFEAWETNCESP